MYVIGSEFTICEILICMRQTEWNWVMELLVREIFGCLLMLAACWCALRADHHKRYKRNCIYIYFGIVVSHWLGHEMGKLKCVSPGILLATDCGCSLCSRIVVVDRYTYMIYTYEYMDSVRRWRRRRRQRWVVVWHRIANGIQINWNICMLLVTGCKCDGTWIINTCVRNTNLKIFSANERVYSLSNLTLILSLSISTQICICDK